MADFYRLRVPLIGDVADQELSVIVEGISFRIRVFYSTFSQLWWLELGKTDDSVTLSQIILRPDVFRNLNGWVPGYGGNAFIGIQAERDGAQYAKLDAFSGDFSLYFISDAE